MLNADRYLVKSFREQFKLTQGQLGQLLGINWQIVKQWESGRNKPPAYISRALNDIARELSGKSD